MGSSRDSSSLATGDNSEIGRYDLDTSVGLFGFIRGITLPTFHKLGIPRLLSDRFSVDVRKSMPLGPICFSMMGEIPSGPKALEFLVALIAAAIWSFENSPMLSCLSLCMRLSVFLAVLFICDGCGVN